MVASNAVTLAGRPRGASQCTLLAVLGDVGPPFIKRPTAAIALLVSIAVGVLGMDSASQYAP